MLPDEALAGDCVFGSDPGPSGADRNPISSAAEQTLQFLRGPGNLALLTSLDPAAFSVALDDIVNEFGEPVFRVANPLITALGLTRLIVQIGAIDDGGDDASLVREHLVGCARPGHPVLLAVSEAHTLDDAALVAITAFATHHNPSALVKVVLAGTPEIEARVAALLALSAETIPVLVLTRAGFPPVPYPTELSTATKPVSVAPVTSVAQTPVPLPSEPRLLSRTGCSGDPALAAPPIAPRHANGAIAPGPKNARRDGSGPLWWGMGAVGASAVIVMVLATVLPQRNAPRSPVPLASTLGPIGAPVGPPVGATDAVQPAAPPLATEPTPSVNSAGPAPSAPANPVVPPAPGGAQSPEPGAATLINPLRRSETSLRRDFRDFLNNTGRQDVARNPVAFQALFQGYLRWRQQTPSERSAPQ